MRRVLKLAPLALLTLSLALPAYCAEITARTKLPRGTVITESDLEVDTGQETDALAFLGKEVVRTIYPGRPLNFRDVSEPILVRRNNRVKMVYRMGRLEINASGRAMGQGSEGDMITVLNLESRKQVEGVVIARGIVEVTQ